MSTFQALIHFAKIARKHNLTRVCLDLLARIYTIPQVPIKDCFQKIRQQVSLYLKSIKSLSLCPWYQKWMCEIIVNVHNEKIVKTITKKLIRFCLYNFHPQQTTNRKTKHRNPTVLFFIYVFSNSNLPIPKLLSRFLSDIYWLWNWIIRILPLYILFHCIL